MKRNDNFVTMIVIIFLGSCTLSAPKSTPTQTPTSPAFTNMITMQPSFTETTLFTLTPPSLIFTPEPSHTKTIYPTLTKGPFIIFLSGHILKILTPDGSSERNVIIPDNLIPGPISPDGKWIVLIENKAFHDKVFYLMNIYQQNIFPIPITPSKNYYYSYTESELNYWLPWSPDGKYLVIIGTSMKIFLYDVENKRVIAIKIDLPLLEDYTWSPDGKHLEITNYEDTMSEFPQREISIVHLEKAADNITASVVRNEECYSPNGWLYSDEYLYSTGGCQISPFYGPISINIHTRASELIWPNHNDGWVIDPVRKILFVYGGKWEDIGDAEKWKYYISTFGGTNKIDVSSKIKDEPGSYSVRYRGGSKYPFIYLRYASNGYADSIYGITQNGNFELLDNMVGINISISPIRRMLAVYNAEGIDIFNDMDILLREYEIDNIQRIYWMDQQERLYLVAENTLYLWILSEDMPKPIYESNNNEECCIQFRWLE